MQIEANGITLFYEQVGSGPPFLLLHGNSEDHKSLMPLAARLQDRYTVYALDSRGHGRSTQVDTFHYADMAEDVAAFIRALGLEKPVILGASDGGIVGLELAYMQPDLPGALIACGANMRPDGLKRWFLWFVRTANRHMKDPKFDMMLQEPDMSAEELGRIRVPTLVLAGSRDIVPEAHTREMASLIPGAQCEILRGQTHSSYLRHPERVEKAITPFLNNLP